MLNCIEDLNARQILDSRGNSTIEVQIRLSNDIEATAKVPSEASTGEFEAIELRDNNKKIFDGKSVLQAIENINSIISAELIGENISNQAQIDALMIELDWTQNKSNLGANAILVVSLAVAKAGSTSFKMPLYQ